MRYLLALLCPPLAILMCGKLLLAMFSVVLLIGYFPAALLALLVVSAKKAEERNSILIKVVAKGAMAQARATEKLAKAIRNQGPTTVVVQVNQVVNLGQPAPEIAPQPKAESTPELPPPAPSPTFRDAWMAIVRVKEGAAFAYRELPEWAQPISWGLMAGSSISLIGAALILITR